MNNLLADNFPLLNLPTYNLLTNNHLYINNFLLGTLELWNPGTLEPNPDRRLLFYFTYL